LAREDLTAAKDAVVRAVTEQRRPPTAEEGVKSVLPVVLYVDEDPVGTKALWRVVSLLRKRKRDV
jgi:hypothetical protein